MPYGSGRIVIEPEGAAVIEGVEDPACDDVDELRDGVEDPAPCEDDEVDELVALRPISDPTAADRRRTSAHILQLLHR